ncbi:Enoyl-CoA hydratase/isomerase family [Nesidiocoris tenuis]|uniref:Enoyl-CoA hydratase/isomerase family n=1 Tax=Nesidiocoris tenuis TaxID=355587 RepID=A0ABN7AMS7_9HEMI|nr:Enoyl-CoA hydratase/isomerase family [Nesidiocoris tenuis]
MAGCLFRFLNAPKCLMILHQGIPVSRNARTLSTGSIKVSCRGPVTWIGIDRTHMKNCLTPRLVTQLLEEIEKFEKNDHLLAAVLYGERGTFSYGIHPTDFQQNSNIYKEILATGLFEKYPVKPIVAALSGNAFGLAFDLALWCDFRVAEETAMLASYARNSGVPVDPSLVSRLNATVGNHRALDWLLTGRAVKAKEGLEAGAVTRIVACGTGLGQAVSFAQSLSNMPQAGLKADRALVNLQSGKFANKTVIEREWKINRDLAEQELMLGRNVTSSGDVRHRAREEKSPAAS